MRRPIIPTIRLRLRREDFNSVEKAQPSMRRPLTLTRMIKKNDEKAANSNEMVYNSDEVFNSNEKAQTPTRRYLPVTRNP